MCTLFFRKEKKKKEKITKKIPTKEDKNTKNTIYGIHNILNKEVRYPKYTYVYNVDNSKCYILLGTTKKEFISTRACWSWSIYCVNTTTAAISNYHLYGKKGFRPGTLVTSVFDDKTYFVGEKYLHPITSPDFYQVLGFSKKQAIIVSTEEIEFYEIGEEISGI